MQKQLSELEEKHKELQIDHDRLSEQNEELKKEIRSLKSEASPRSERTEYEDDDKALPSNNEATTMQTFPLQPSPGHGEDLIRSAAATGASDVGYSFNQRTLDRGQI